MAISPDNDSLLDTEGAAKFLKIPEATLVKWRSTGAFNVPYIKIGRAVRYRKIDLNAYIERHIQGVSTTKKITNNDQTAKAEQKEFA